MADDGLALAAHHLATERGDRALEALDRLPESVAVSPYALLLRGRALLSVDRCTEARRVAERGLAHDPRSPAMLSLLADACAVMDDLQGAEAALLSALRSQPDSADLMADYARVLAEAGQIDKARRVLDRAAELEPESDQVASARTYVALASGDDREALRAARRAIARDPHSVTAQSLLGVSSLLRGEGSTAWRASRTAAGASIGNQHLAELARDARLQAHPTMAGMRLITRVGQVQVWLAGLFLIFVVSRLFPDPVRVAIVVAWLVFVVYSWTAEPLLRLWARWRW